MVHMYVALHTGVQCAGCIQQKRLQLPVQAGPCMVEKTTLTANSWFHLLAFGVLNIFLQSRINMEQLIAICPVLEEHVCTHYVLMLCILHFHSFSSPSRLENLAFLQKNDIILTITCPQNRTHSPSPRNNT